MGSSFKKAVVPQRVHRVLHTWHKDAKKRLKKGERADDQGTEKLTGESLEFDNINLTSPMSVAMEEGSRNRYTILFCYKSGFNLNLSVTSHVFKHLLYVTIC